MGIPIRLIMDKSKFNDRKEWRKFAFGLTIILSLVATVQLILGKSIYPYFYIASLIILILNIIIPVSIKPVFIFFSYLGFSINWIVSMVILILLFYLVFTPMGLFGKLLGKRFLDLRFRTGEETYWIDKEQGELDTKNYENQF